MDRHFFHIHPVHGLVAELLTRDPELATGAAGLFRHGRTHHVLRRLVNNAQASSSSSHPAEHERFFLRIYRKNRPFVEGAAEKVLRRIDLLNIQAHYARSRASGVWLLELGDKIIGVIAVDASLDATNDELVTQQSREQVRTSIKQTGTSRIATIRHFFAEEAFRRVGIEDDLLEFAIESTFNGDRAVKSIRMLASPLRPAILNSLRRNKFVKGERAETGGIQRWEFCWYTLERSQWEAGK